MTDEELGHMVKAAVARFDAMTPEQQREHRREQDESYARAEVAFGSDADETAYRDALQSGDHARIAKEESKAAARIKFFEGTRE